MRRAMIHIDEEKCTGCGDCITACAEGALQVIDGKAKLLGEIYCDGLGACLGECPEGALTVEEREAEAFDEEAVRQHLAAQWVAGGSPQPGAAPAPAFSCPSAQLLTIDGSAAEAAPAPPAGGDARLGHWPIKLRLVPPEAPFLRDADVVLMADCVPFARPEVTRENLPDKALLIGCPKCEDWDSSLRRLTQIVQAPIRSLSVVRMEVPCCSGFWHLAQSATKAAGAALPLEQVVVSVSGETLPATAGGV